MAENSNAGFVDAIEEGRIVRVSETYARIEGLTILRKSGDFEWGDSNYYKKQATLNLQEKKPELKHKRGVINLEPYRKPLKYAENDIASSLIDNFHWVLIQKRKQRALTRKQLGEAISEKEEAIKSIENGIVPANNYILVNKLERYFGVTLRKDGSDFSKTMNEVMNKANAEEISKEPDKGNNLPKLENIDLDEAA